MLAGPLFRRVSGLRFVPGSSTWMKPVSGSGAGSTGCILRGDVMLEATGIIVVHDCRKSCSRMPNVAGHGICCTHVPRELESLFQFGREKWAGDLAVLLFTRNPPVPATNNITELDLEMEKVRQKISGYHRSMEGAINRAIIKTVPATACRQRWNMPDTLRRSSPEPIASLEVDLPMQAPG